MGDFVAHRSVGFVVALAGVIAVPALTTTMFIPALPAIKLDLRADPQLLQLTVSLPLIVVIAVVPLIGELADRIGRRPVVLVSASTALLGCVICFAAPNLWVLIVGRVIAGASATSMLTVGRAITKDAYDPQDLTRAMARYLSGPILALLVAPLLGAALTEAFGWRGMLVALAGAIAVIGTLSLSQLQETWQGNATYGTARSAKKGLHCLVRSRAFLGYAWQSALHFAVAFGFVSAAPYLVTDVLGQPSTVYARWLLLVLVGMLAGVFLAERLTATIAAPRQVLIGSLFGALSAALSPALLCFTSLTVSLEILFLPATLVALGIGFATPGSQALIVDAVPEAAGLASGVSIGLNMIMAASFAHLTILPWGPAGIAIGVTAFAGMLLAVAVVAALQRPASVTDR
ncbi:MAG: MFS transporter [Pseudomonadota bacterium]